jgi:hypothetical protein
LCPPSHHVPIVAQCCSLVHTSSMQQSIKALQTHSGWLKQGYYSFGPLFSNFTPWVSSSHAESLLNATRDRPSRSTALVMKSPFAGWVGRDLKDYLVSVLSESLYVSQCIPFLRLLQKVTQNASPNLLVRPNIGTFFHLGLRKTNTCNRLQSQRSLSFASKWESSVLVVDLSF